jgi:hypothetical protein
MAGKARSRSQQIVAIAAARTHRAADAVQAAQREVADAEAALQLAKAECDAAQATITEAQRLLSQSPGSEQHRLWLTRCRDTHAECCAQVENGRAQRADAEMALQQAMTAWQRQQLRQDHLTRHAAREGQQAERISERRIEDEQQGQSAGAGSGQSSGSNTTAMAL